MESERDTFYSSHQKLPFISNRGQELFQAASVLVIGAGGLGCPCLQSLSGCGIGRIGIVDFDRVSLSNLHRQFLYRYDDTGELKTEKASTWIKQYNPFISIKPFNLFLDESNILELLAAYDIIVDCTDNFSSRYLINDACVYLNKPLVYGAIHQADGHVTVFNYLGSPTLRCLFPKDDNDSIASCATIGAYNIATGIIGLMMANEVIKIILGRQEILAGKLIQVDILSGSMVQIQFVEGTASRQKSKDRFSSVRKNEFITPGALKEQLISRLPIQLIDVREAEEHKAFNIGGQNIPMNALMKPGALHFSKQQTIVCYCQKGNRSLQAIRYLNSIGFEKSCSLQGGIELWQKLFDSN